MSKNTSYTLHAEKKNVCSIWRTSVSNQRFTCKTVLKSCLFNYIFFLLEMLTELTVLLDLVVSHFKPDAVQRMGHQAGSFLSLNPSPVVELLSGQCSSTFLLILYFSHFPFIQDVKFGKGFLDG